MVEPSYINISSSKGPGSNRVITTLSQNTVVKQQHINAAVFRQVSESSGSPLRGIGLGICAISKSRLGSQVIDALGHLSWRSAGSEETVLR